MHNFKMPRMCTEEEIYNLRREAIMRSGAYNTEEALKWFDEEPDIDLIWVDLADIYHTIGINPHSLETGKGWLYKGNEPPLMQLPNGKYIEIEAFNNCAVGWDFEGKPEIIIDWPDHVVKEDIIPEDANKVNK